MKKIIFLLTLLITPLLIKSQEFIKQNTLHLEGKDVSETNIQELIIRSKESREKIFFSNSEISNLKNDINTFNLSIESKINENLKKIDNLKKNRQEINRLRTIPDLSMQIKTLENQLTKNEKELTKRLEEISYSGLFIYIERNIDILQNPKIFIDNSKKRITPKAIENINGFFIQSITESFQKEGNDDLFFSQINKEVKGTLQVEKNLGQKINNKEKIFWIINQVSVAPLQEKLNTTTSNSIIDSEDILIIDALKENVEKELNLWNIPQNIKSEIIFIVSQNKDLVINRNKTQFNEEKDIIKKGVNNILEQKSEINSLRKELISKKDRLKNLVEENLGIEYTENNFESIYREAESKIGAQIDQLEKDEVELREKIVRGKFDKIVNSSGDPINTIAHNVYEIKKQLEASYGVVEKFNSNEQLITDSYTYSEKKENTINQIIRNIWFYPETLDDGFKIHVIANFEILEEFISENSLYVNINSNPLGANIFIDEKDIGQTPMKKRLNPGVHNFKLVKAGYDVYNKQINVNQEIDSVNIILKETETLLIVNCYQENVSVSIDNKHIGNTPLKIKMVIPTHFTLELQKEGYQTKKLEYLNFIESKGNSSYDYYIIQEQSGRDNFKEEILVNESLESCTEFNIYSNLEEAKIDGIDKFFPSYMTCLTHGSHIFNNEIEFNISLSSPKTLYFLTELPIAEKEIQAEDCECTIDVKNLSKYKSDDKTYRIIGYGASKNLTISQNKAILNAYYNLNRESGIELYHSSSNISRVTTEATNENTSENSSTFKSINQQIIQTNPIKCITAHYNKTSEVYNSYVLFEFSKPIGIY